MLNVDKLKYSIGSKQILKGVSFSLKEKEIAALIGPSGSGKTTLFKLLTGMLPLQSGTIEIKGLHVPEAYNQTTYMMQENLLLPWRTVLGNMTLTAELGQQTRPKKELLEEAEELLSEIGLPDCGNKYPSELSGGMKQRVSLARALMHRRPLLLLDEPFGGLDIYLREQMYDLLRQIQKKHGTTILLVTHDFRDALTLCDRIFRLGNGIIADEWKIYPEQRQSPDFIGTLHEILRTAIING
jgi:ABC-type nitrate/sulfonate/bicarbonate transport system ATPase subunit